MKNHTNALLGLACGTVPALGLAPGSKGEPPTSANDEKERAVNFAKAWMKKNYGPSSKWADRDLYYTKLGFLIDFVTDFIEPSNNEVSDAPLGGRSL